MNQELAAALQPPPINTSPGATYASSARQWQGIPGIERARNGRLWVVWYSGGSGEGPDNYIVAVTSGDDGRSWSAPQLAIHPPGRVRAFDPCLWHDPLGRLWLFWAQSLGKFDGRAGVWCSLCSDSTVAPPQWSTPRRICNGVMMNKPTVLTTGEWLLPAAVWAYGDAHLPEMDGERLANVHRSTDHGQSWLRLGGADVPDRQFDEHMIIERSDGTLWMLVRTRYGIGQSVSKDRGHTWSPGTPTALGGPGSRFFVRRLRSGRLLLVNHVGFTGRSHLTAMLSEDDGQSWHGGLLLDGRSNVSYPDGVEGDDGRLFVIYDRERYGAREILMAVFTEHDIMERAPLSSGARLAVLVDRVGDVAAVTG